MTPTTDAITDAIVEHNRLRKKLAAQWSWFTHHPHHPETETREEVFLRTLHRYEACCDRITHLRRDSVVV